MDIKTLLWLIELDIRLAREAAEKCVGGYALGAAENCIEHIANAVEQFKESNNE